MEPAASLEAARVVARGLVYGMVVGAVLEGGRQRLRLHGDLSSSSASGVGESFLSTVVAAEPRWGLYYDGGDHAVLTWLATGEQELVDVPSESDRRSLDARRQELVAKVLHPRLLTH